jgi:serine/threonine-protein phosphatase 5
MNKVYGFEGEAKDKYGDMTYKLFADVFTASTYLLTSSSSPSPSPNSRSLLLFYTRLVPSELVRANTQSH